MSNSIWKTPAEKAKGFSLILEHYKSYDFDNNKDISAYNVFKTSGNPQSPFDGNTIRWCYLDNLIAQADKAERLEKENEAMREEFEVWHGNHKCVLEDNERLQKAVDLAVLRLEQGKKKFGKSTMGPNKETAMLCEIVIDEIKQLIKKETTNDK